MAEEQAKRYSPREELANSVTHGLGVGLAIAGLAILVSFAGMMGDPWRIVSFSIYGTSLVLLYLASTLYHAISKPKLKQRFRLFDHSAIFLLIAGSYTPISLVTLQGGWGWTLFGLIWGFAILGIILTILLKGRMKILILGIYLAMGWLCVIAGKPLVESLPTGGLVWLGAGGAAYTGGVAFYVWKKLPYNHAIWHLFVLAGSICHFMCFLLYVLPEQAS